MEKDFSLTELQTIQSLAEERMSVDEIADLIGRPLQEVAIYMGKFRRVNQIAKKEKAEKKKRIRENEMSLPIVNKVVEKEKEESKFPVRVQDYSKMKAVRIDSKTVIYVKSP